jgi:hypothetical protein
MIKVVLPLAAAATAFGVISLAVAEEAAGRPAHYSGFASNGYTTPRPLRPDETDQSGHQVSKGNGGDSNNKVEIEPLILTDTQLDGVTVLGYADLGEADVALRQQSRELLGRAPPPLSQNGLDVTSAPETQARTTPAPSPAGVTSTQGGVTSIPVGVTSTPVGVTSIPAGVTSTQGGVTSIPVGVTSTPVGVTSTAETQPATTLAPAAAAVSTAGQFGATASIGINGHALRVPDPSAIEGQPMIQFGLSGALPTIGGIAFGNSR